MKHSFALTLILGSFTLMSASDEILEQKEIELITAPSPSALNVSYPANNYKASDFSSGAVLAKERPLLINVIGQGVAPLNTTSPAQAYALAKRAATADGYRLIAEKVKGVHVEGQDYIQNMMVKRSTIRTSVSAIVKSADIVETTFKEGLCEVEMEIMLSHSQFAQ